jgi:hypothetical protein
MMVIYTGSAKCHVRSMLECPACGDEFDFLDGICLYSQTVKAELNICAKHAGQKMLRQVEEDQVKRSYEQALQNPRGHIIDNGRFVHVGKVLAPTKHKILRVGEWLYKKRKR